MSKTLQPDIEERREMRLDQIGRVVSGSTPSTANPENWGGSIMWLTPADLSELSTRHIEKSERTLTPAGLDRCAANLLPARSLVISSRAPIGHMALPLSPFCTNQGCKSIEFFTGQDPDFHYYNLRLWAKRIHDKGEGTTFAEISKTALAAVKVPVPVNLKVQTKIAEVLTNVDRAIEQTEALLAKEQRIKAGLMHDLLTRGLDAKGELRDPAKHRFKPSRFGRIPKEWRPSTVGAECTEVCVGIVIRPTQYYSEQGVIALRSLNVMPGFFDLSNIVKISHEANERLTKSRLNDGDVVTVRTGEPGTSAVVGADLAGANCIDLVISRHGRKLRPGFLALWINSAFGKKYVGQNQGGLAQQHFNVGAMKILPIPMPETDEQDAIILRATAINCVVDDLHDNVAKLRRLKTGLMQDLLTGRVPVTPLHAAKKN